MTVEQADVDAMNAGIRTGTGENGDKRGAVPDKKKPTPKNHTADALIPADHLQLYINRAKQYPTLSREEERELAIHYQRTGDKDAAFRLVTSNLMLVVKIAFEFRSQFQTMLDLVQEGNYGLMRAVQKFDPFKGVRLSTYASYWIRAYMLKFLLDNWRLVKVGTTNIRRKLLYRLREMEEKLTEKGAMPTSRMLAEHFGATEEDIVEVQKSLGAGDTSIHQPVEEGSGRRIIDVLPADGHDYAEEIGSRQELAKFRTAVGKFRETLKPSDRDIMDKRILSENPLKLRELGALHGVTREATRQAEARLLKRLKAFMKQELAGVDGATPDAPGEETGDSVKKR